MSDTVSDIVRNAGKPLDDVPNTQRLDESGQKPETVARRNDGDIIHRSTPDAPMVVDGSSKQISSTAEKQELGTLPQAKHTNDEQVDEIINKVDPDNPGHYKHPRYYAQTGNRRGFIYTWRDPKGIDRKTVFETGLVVSTEMAFCQAIEGDIKRSGGIGHIVREVTRAHYEELMNSANRFAHIRANGGMSNTIDADPIAAAKIAENNQLKAQIAEMQRELDALQGKKTVDPAEKPAGLGALLNN